MVERISSYPGAATRPRPVSTADLRLLFQVRGKSGSFVSKFLSATLAVQSDFLSWQWPTLRCPLLETTPGAIRAAFRMSLDDARYGWLGDWVEFQVARLSPADRNAFNQWAAVQLDGRAANLASDARFAPAGPGRRALAGQALAMRHLARRYRNAGC